MFWLFILAITMPISLGNCEKAVNLTEVTWDHAVNSWKQLNHTLTSKSHFLDDNFFRNIFDYIMMQMR